MPVGDGHATAVSSHSLGSALFARALWRVPQARPRLLVEDGRKTGHTFSHPDLIIAATALPHGLTVVTCDVSDYQKARAPVLNPWLDTPPMRSSAESNAT